MADMISINKSEGAVHEASGAALVLNCTDTPLHHWVVRSDGLEMMVNVNQGNSEPEVLVRDGFLFLGVEQGVYAIDIETASVVTQIMDIANVQWIEEDAVDHVVFAVEDELIVLENAGKLLWRKNLPEIIETTNISNGCLCVTDMSGGEFEFNLEDGSEVVG